MQLYTLPASPNSRKALAVIRHLGLDVDVRPLDFARGETRTPAFLALNRNGMVPVLVDGDFVLWESNAICAYLVDRTGGSPLYPRELKVRADINRWLSWEQAHFNRAFGTLVFESIIKPKFGMGEPSRGLVDFCLQETGVRARVLDSHLAGRDTLVGDDITIADYAMVSLENYRDATPFDWTPFANINRYFDAIRSTEAWMKATSVDAAVAASEPVPA
ncbi:MAG: glutathione S-transferase family protein [Mesorhizobium sp.]|nr:glutathione S-transferase family protein [Mesorhizobium sp.]MBN9243203.1 glutathione S-transferase family protein [Mesorhizobium sp.]